MKHWWIAGALATAAIVAPALAQEDPVKAGVDAWTRGDYGKAVTLWRGPAIAGNADAQFNLGQAYKLGRGVPQNLEMAEEWFRKSALQGHPQAEDNYGLVLFQNGKRTQSVPWLQKSAGRGEPRAQYVLGTMYFNGDSVERDWVKAYALMTRASQSGLPQASAALAEMDRYVSLDDRQKGLSLARKYEEEAGRPDLPTEYAGPVAAPRPIPTATPKPTRAVPAQRPTPRPTEAATRDPAPAAPVARDGGWRVQLGAFGEAGNARKLWGQVGGRFAGRQPYYVKAGPLTKLLVGPYASQSEAAAACRAVNPCIPVRK